MSRIHAFELEDQPWFPAVIRDAGTAYLRFATRFSGQAANITPKIAEILERSGETRIIDLCSGGAGPVPTIVQGLSDQGVEVNAWLTDLYPNKSAFEHVAQHSEGRIRFVEASVDATRVPPSLEGLRTLFNGLHHFRPEQVRQLLQDAVDAQQPVAAVEFVGRHPLVLIAILTAFIPVMLVVPFLRPFQWRWLLFTYLIPIIPLFVVWDGLISCLRVYSEDELTSIIGSLNRGENYDWEFADVSMTPLPVGAKALVGLPKRGRAGRASTRQPAKAASTDTFSN